MTRQTTRFLVLDDHPVLRQGVASVLRANFDDAEVGEAANVDDAVSLARKGRVSAVIVDPHLGFVLQESHKIIPGYPRNVELAHAIIAQGLNKSSSVNISARTSNILSYIAVSPVNP